MPALKLLKQRAYEDVLAAKICAAVSVTVPEIVVNESVATALVPIALIAFASALLAFELRRTTGAVPIVPLTSTETLTIYSLAEFAFANSFFYKFIAWT